MLDSFHTAHTDARFASQTLSSWLALQHQLTSDRARARNSSVTTMKSAE